MIKQIFLLEQFSIRFKCTVSLSGVPFGTSLFFQHEKNMGEGRAQLRAPIQSTALSSGLDFARCDDALTNTYLLLFKKTINPNLSPIGKRFGFECFGADNGT